MSLENKILEIHKENPIKRILHIGAHLGDEIDFYHKLNPEVIYWFEANPELIQGLKQRISNHPTIEQHVFPYAVSSWLAPRSSPLVFRHPMHAFSSLRFSSTFSFLLASGERFCLLAVVHLSRSYNTIRRK